MNPYLPERADLLFLAEGFAENVIEHNGEKADAWIDAYFVAAAGGFPLFNRDDDGCAVLTRGGDLCRNPLASGLRVCRLHDKLIQRREGRRADA